MATLMLDDDNNIVRVSKHNDGSLPMGFGPKHQSSHRAYLTSPQRRRDVLNTTKEPTESDSSADSSDDDENVKEQSKQPRMTRREQKQLDRELPWRTILATMSKPALEQFIKPMTPGWNGSPSRPLDDKQTQQVLDDPQLRKRCLRSRQPTETRTGAVVS